MSDKKKKTFKLKSLTNEPVRKSNSCTSNIHIKLWKGLPLDPEDNPVTNPQKYTK